MVDLVFVIDGSGSITDASWELQKAGIRECLSGPNAFVPPNGTVAMGVVRFEDSIPAVAEIPLTTIDSPATAAAFTTQVGSISRTFGGTDLEAGLKAAIDLLRTGFGSQRLIVVATDMCDEGMTNSLDLAAQIRTGTGYATGLGQTRICSVYIDPEPCASVPENTPNPFLRSLANTFDAYPGPYLDQPIGHYTCVHSAILPPDGPDPQAVRNFAVLCGQCGCTIVYAGTADCDSNGLPDICEITQGTVADCNQNGIPDPCDTRDGTSSDCNGNAIPDGCEPACGVAGRPPLDCNPAGDEDGDGLPNSADNCPCSANPDQRDCDGDGIGNACDPTPGSIFDHDGDCDVDQEDFGLLQRCGMDVFSTVPAGPQCDLMDFNGDGMVILGTYGYLAPTLPDDLAAFQYCSSGPSILAKSACGDCNGDRIPDGRQDFNPDLFVRGRADGDADLDGIGFVGRAICQSNSTSDCDDNCPCVPNPDQLDSDGDGRGDACDPPPQGGS